MPPRKRTTRAAKKAEPEEPAEATIDLEQPPSKKPKGRGKKVAAEEAAGDKSSNGQPDTQSSSAKAAKGVKTKTGTLSVKSDPPIPRDVPELKEPNLKQPSLPLLGPSSPLKSPSKTATSRIPVSPVRKSSLGSKASVDVFDIKKVESSIHQTFSTKNVPKLTSILDDLKTTRAEQNFSDLKASLDSRARASQDLIASLSAKNEDISLQLESALARISELEQQSAPNGHAATVSEEAEYENQLILDMIEQIVGLRIHNTEDSDASLAFTCSQSGKNGILDYRLIINKADSSEIIYEPLNTKEETDELKRWLPEYFFDDLTFPLDTLQQFYHKIYRGLNK